jgi:hypothetical protein
VRTRSMMVGAIASAALLVASVYGAAVAVAGGGPSAGLSALRFWAMAGNLRQLEPTAPGPVAITDDDLFEVLDWVTNGILAEFPPAVRDALLTILEDPSLRGVRTTRALNRYRRAAHGLRQALLDLADPAAV